MNSKNYLSFILILAVCFTFPASDLFAQFGGGAGAGPGNGAEDRIKMVIDLILSYLEGSFGALVMVIGGVLAIISAAFGQYRAALSLLIVACGCFILRALVQAFFGDVFTY